MIGKYGDKAMEFVWKNKGALAVGAALAAFLNDPEPFIEGTKELASVVTTNAIAPVAEEVAKKTNWTLTIVGLAFVGALYLAFRKWLSQKIGRFAGQR